MEERIVIQLGRAASVAVAGRVKGWRLGY